MDKDKEFTSKNTFYHSAYLTSMPPKPGEIEHKEAKIKEKAQGRKIITVCCNDTAEYLNKALEIGMDAGQKAVFENWFDHHKGYTHFSTYRDPESKGYDIGQMIDAIFDAVNEIKYPHELQNHFLNCIEEDVKRICGNPIFDYPRNKFLKMLQQRLQKPICNAIEFKTDLSELCERCPLKESIPKGIQTQIVAEAEDNRELMRTEQFREWIDEQIKAATKVMQEMRKDAMHPAQHYLNVLTEHFIWNKERAKALRAMLSNTAQVEPELEPLPTFEDLFFNQANADKVRGLMPPNSKYVKSICFAMATALKEKSCCPKYSKEVIARVLVAEFYSLEYPKYFRAKRYTGTDIFDDFRMQFYKRL